LKILIRFSLFPNNEFAWREVYQVFSAVSYTVMTQRETIQFGKSSTSYKSLLHSNAIFLRLGQTCTIDHVGNMGMAYGPVDPSSRSFSVTNNWNQPVNVGASCVLMTTGSPTFTPIDFYVSLNQVDVSETIKLTSIDQISCCFEEADYTGSNPKEQTISYNASGQWQKAPISMMRESVSIGAGNTTTPGSDSAAQSAETVTAVTATTTTTS
jgi:hypothetical protein